MRILFIGDIVGAPGRKIVCEDLAHVVAENGIDLTIANCENAASGFGITPRLVEELLSAGVEVLSGGNHIFDRKEILDYFAHELRVLRPANLAPGNGAGGVNLVLVDFHAEATSEKQAMGHYLDGRVTAVLGTHTHVATADEQVLPKGTAYITDVGMTGPHDS